MGGSTQLPFLQYFIRGRLYASWLGLVHFYDNLRNSYYFLFITDRRLKFRKAKSLASDHRKESGKVCFVALPCNSRASRGLMGHVGQV